MLNLLTDIITFPVRALKKVPVRYRFYLIVVLAFGAGACFITANQGYAHTPLSILGWVLVAAILDVFIYANNEEKAIEADEKASLGQ